MQSSWKLFSVFGIPVRFDLSVGILALYLLFVTGSLLGGLYMAAVLLVSILLHELAHCAGAIGFGGQVRDIRLQLLGGCATITRMPTKPWQECIMALLGPLCSFTIAAITYAAAFHFYREVYDPAQNTIWIVPNDWFFLAALLNFGLGCFNLIPAFPMDGGRILRSFLQIFGLTKLKATRVAVLVGRGIAIVWTASFVLHFLGIAIPCPEGAPAWIDFFWGYFFGGSSIFIVLIAYMVWVMGQREYDAVCIETLYGDRR